jgi:hypothetical protein
VVWGLQDVSEMDARAHVVAMTPQSWERIQPVMQARLEASRKRERIFDERIALLHEIENWLRRLLGP